ncbi:MAG: PEP-CTERM sorting domain-containing protein [Luteolibacter sp.]
MKPTAFKPFQNLSRRVCLSFGVGFSIGLLSMSSALADTIYLNSAQATANNALSVSNSWWTDSTGATAYTGTVSASTNVLAFNNLVTAAWSGRTGGGTGGSLSISGFQILNPGGAITVTAGTNNTTQTVTLNGSIGIDMSEATQDFTFKSGAATGPANLRVGSNQSWIVQAGRTFTVGDLSAGTTTAVTVNGTRTLTLAGNGATAMGSFVFNGNFGASTLGLVINGTGTSSSGGNVYFNGVTNTFSGFSLTNATATFGSNSVVTTTGALTINTGGVLTNYGTFSTASVVTNNGTMNGVFTFTGTLQGSGIFNGAVTVNGALSPGSQTYNDGLTLGVSAVTTLEIEEVGNTDFIDVTAGTFTLNGALNIIASNSFDVDTPGTYDLYSGTTGDSFTAVSVFGKTLSDLGGLWTGTSDEGSLYTFTQSTGILEITAVPEPSAFLLGGLSLLGLLRRRRAA